MKRSIAYIAIAWTVFLAGVQKPVVAQAQPAPRRPRGIYAVVNIADAQKANPSFTAVELNAYLSNLYRDLLGNPAISGLTLQVHWDTLNPNREFPASVRDAGAEQ
jgi:hypothetical protein